MNKYEVGIYGGIAMEIEADSWRGFGRGSCRVKFYNNRAVEEKRFWGTKKIIVEDIVLIVADCKYIKTLHRENKS